MSAETLRVIPRPELGAALILIMLAMVLVASSALIMFARALGPASGDLDVSDMRRMDAVHQALRGYAAAQQSHPGGLPCPDQTGDGTSQGAACTTNAVQIGRVPYRTLGLPRESHDLWLAITPEVHNNGARVINPDVNSELQLLSADPTGGYAAVILAPGPPLQGQRDRFPGSMEEGQYLESENADVDSFQFRDCRLFADCNDRAIGISIDRLFVPVQFLVLEALESIIAEHYSGPGETTLPYAAELGSTPLQRTQPNLESGLLPLMPDDEEMEVCEAENAGEGAECFDVCDMIQWVRPKGDNGDLGDYGCGTDAEGGNDWLRFVTYTITSGCRNSGGDCTATIGFLEGFEIRGHEEFELTIGLGDAAE